MYTICHLSIIPLRAEPSDRSEMVSQLLFGEMAEVIEVKGTWQKIRLAHDNYIGWIDEKQMQKISEEEFKNLSQTALCISSDLVYTTVNQNNEPLNILRGSSLPFLSQNKIKLSGNDIDYKGNFISAPRPDISRCEEYAKLYLNAPYLWGGRSSFGIDCSGFTQIVMKFCGISLQRDAYQQAEQGQTINLLDESQTGDLAFFENVEGKIIHVGIILPEKKIIHASGKVRIDSLDHEGIYNSEGKRYSHKLRLIKRVN